MVLSEIGGPDRADALHSGAQALEGEAEGDLGALDVGILCAECGVSRGDQSLGDLEVVQGYRDGAGRRICGADTSYGGGRGSDAGTPGQRGCEGQARASDVGLCGHRQTVIELRSKAPEVRQRRAARVMVHSRSAA